MYGGAFRCVKYVLDCRSYHEIQTVGNIASGGLRPALLATEEKVCAGCNTELSLSLPFAILPVIGGFFS